jgi:hypothetical protein
MQTCDHASVPRCLGDDVSEFFLINERSDARLEQCLKMAEFAFELGLARSDAGCALASSNGILEALLEARLDDWKRVDALLCPLCDHAIHFGYDLGTAQVPTSAFHRAVDEIDHKVAALASWLG